MKIKLPQLLFGSAVALGLLAMTAGTLAYIVKGRKTASTQGVASADYDPTPGRYVRHTRLEFSTSPPRPRAGQMAIWSVKIVDPKKQDRHGQPKYIRSFVQDKGNLINLVVVSQDLEYFTRLQPDYKDYGHFLLQATLPRPGAYRLYADYIPYAGRREVAQQEIAIEVDADTAPAAPKLIADRAGGNAIIKRVTAQTAAGEDGATYEVELGPARLCRGKGNTSTSLFAIAPVTWCTMSALFWCFGTVRDCVAGRYPRFAPGVSRADFIRCKGRRDNTVYDAVSQGRLLQDMGCSFKRNEEVITRRSWCMSQGESACKYS
jgi:hypothetical protein